MGLRLLASELLQRAALAAAGETYDGRRNVSQVCGYKDTLTLYDYRKRYQRNEIAARVVETMPKSTWRGGGVVVENPDPETETPFEAAWNALDARLNLWSLFQRADILSGLGQYSVILIGADGELNTPLPRMKSVEDVVYLSPLPQSDVGIETWEEDTKNERFSFPLTYTLHRRGAKGPGAQKRSVHYTRILHVADGLLDDSLFGTPRLERVWNRLDDLEKVVGGGSEAFWRRADQGMQIDIDPEIELDDIAEKKLNDEVDEYVNGFKRIMKTRGTKLNALGSDVANFGPSVESLIGLICAGSSIPQRILLGSERGQLASDQDRENWNERVADRRTSYAEQTFIDMLVTRLVETRALPEPKQYQTWWPAIRDYTMQEKADIVAKFASANSANGAVGGEIIQVNEIRDLILELGPIDVERIINDRVPRAAQGKWRKQILSIARQTDTSQRLSA